MTLRPRPRSPFGPKLVVGLLLILAGALMLFENVGLLEDGHWHLFGPFALLLFGLSSLISRGPLHLGGHVLLFFGTCFLLAGLDRAWIPDTWWPLGLVWIGAVVVLKALVPHAEPSSESLPEPCEDAMRGTHD